MSKILLSATISIPVKNTLFTEIEKVKAGYWIVSPLLIAAALFAYKTNSSIRVLQSTWNSGTIAARPSVVEFGQQVSAIGALERSVNYFQVIWPALAFGILIGAAVRAFVSPRIIAHFVTGKPVKTQLTASLAGAPLMLCSCCVAPIFTSVAETSARLGPALGLMLASPALNPAALALTFMLFETKVAGTRLLISLMAVLLIGPAVERMFRDIRTITPSEPEMIGNSGVRAFLKSVASVGIRTIPGLVIGVVVSMLIVQFLPAQIFATAGAKYAAILITATLAVPLALPTFLEIPLSLSLLAAGFPAGAVVALLFAGPTVNIPSLLSVGRVSGWKVALSVAVLGWVLAVAGGLLVG